jgi:hypothetical protein
MAVAVVFPGVELAGGWKRYRHRAAVLAAVRSFLPKNNLKNNRLI